MTHSSCLQYKGTVKLKMAQADQHSQCYREAREVSQSDAEMVPGVISDGDSGIKHSIRGSQEGLDGAGTQWQDLCQLRTHSIGHHWHGRCFPTVFFTV